MPSLKLNEFLKNTKFKSIHHYVLGFLRLAQARAGAVYDRDENVSLN